MDQKKYFLLLTEAEVLALDLALDGLVDAALADKQTFQAKALLGIQLQCQYKREIRRSPQKKVSDVREPLVGKANSR
jgi:hypothetical protein